MDVVNSLYQNCTTIERCFNIAGCVPVVGIFSGRIREKAAKVQLEAGFIIGVTGIIFSVATDDKNWPYVAYLGANLVLHGALNAIRGSGEQVFGLTGLGSLLLIVPNLVTKFDPWVSYSSSE